MRHTLCYDAPEGFHAPDVGDEDEDVELDRKSKDTLSFCWRALKEARSASIKVYESWRDAVLRYLAIACLCEQ